MKVDRDALIALIEALRGFGGVVIVEGTKDVRALATHGVKATALTTSIDVQFEGITHANILILTDRDREGRKRLAQARAACERLGLIEDRGLRTCFFATTHLRQVEGFDTLCERLGIDTPF
jgi:hypothetical protein